MENPVLHFSIQLPPLNSSPHSNPIKNKIVQVPNKYNEIKKLRNDLSSKINIENAKNLESIRTKSSNVLSIIGEIKPEVARRQQQETSISEDIRSIRSAIEKINSNIYQIRSNADLYQIRLDLNIFQKANQTLREFSTDVSNLSKRIDASEAKNHKKELKIKEKLESLRLSLDLKQTENRKPDISSRIHKRIDRISSFVQNVQFSLLLKYIKNNNNSVNPVIAVRPNGTDRNIVNELNNTVEMYQSQLENKIRHIQQQYENKKAKISSSQELLALLDKRNKDESLKINDVNEKVKNMEDEIEARLSSAEDMLKKLIESLNNTPIRIDIRSLDDSFFKLIEDQSMNDIKKLANDWELFHKNNCTVQSQVYDIIDNFDNKISENGSFLNRLNAAERLVNYCKHRISVWQNEEEEKMQLSVTDNQLFEKMIELEEKVQIAEARIKQIDENEPEVIVPYPKLKRKFKLSIPPPQVAPKADLNPFYIENNLILTYDQQQFNGDNNLDIITEIPSPSFVDVQVDPDLIKKETPVEVRDIKDNESDDDQNNNSDDSNNYSDDSNNYSDDSNNYSDDDDNNNNGDDNNENKDDNKVENNNENNIDDNKEKKAEEKKDDSRFNSSSGMSPNLYHLFRIRRRNKRDSNRCYNPFKPIKKGDIPGF